MISTVTQFAASSTGGISSLGVNLKGFLFQLITFVIVLLILRRWVFPKLVATLEDRRKTLEESLLQARQTEEALKTAEQKAGVILQKARAQADAALLAVNSRSEEIIAKAEAAAAERAERIIAEAEKRLSQEHNRLSTELKRELAGLVAVATEKVLRQKINETEDRTIIERSLKELA